MIRLPFYIIPLIFGYWLFSDDFILIEYSDIKDKENQISKLELKLSDIQSGIELMPTIESWESLGKGADKLGLNLKWLPDFKYDGIHHSISGELSGDPHAATALLGQHQKDHAVVLHFVEMKNGLAIYTVSVLGVDI